jgi:hypothetical protein
MHAVTNPTEEADVDNDMSLIFESEAVNRLIATGCEMLHLNPRDCVSEKR